MIKAPSPTVTNFIATVLKPIQAKTLVKEANRRRGIDSRGTLRDCRRLREITARMRDAVTPARPRAKSGGQSRSNIFINGQFSAQPDAVTTRQIKPIHCLRRTLLISAG